MLSWLCEHFLDDAESTCTDIVNCGIHFMMGDLQTLVVPEFPVPDHVGNVLGLRADVHSNERAKRRVGSLGMIFISLWMGLFVDVWLW